MADVRLYLPGLAATLERHNAKKPTERDSGVPSTSPSKAGPGGRVRTESPRITRYDEIGSQAVTSPAIAAHWEAHEGGIRSAVTWMMRNDVSGPSTTDFAESRACQEAVQEADLRFSGLFPRVHDAAK